VSDKVLRFHMGVRHDHKGAFMTEQRAAELHRPQWACRLGDVAGAESW
jgi:hypothetical protein